MYEFQIFGHAKANNTSWGRSTEEGLLAASFSVLMNSSKK